MPTMPRRSNLSGHTRADGRTEIRVTLTRLDGSKYRKSVYGDTPSEAQYNALKLIHETGRTLQESVTVQELADIWKASWKKLAPDTKRSYEYALSLILPKLGPRECHTLKVPDLMQLVLRQDTDRKARLCRVVMGTMFNYGVMIGAVEANPLVGLRVPRGYKPVRQRPTMQDLHDALKGMDVETALFFRFLADTGLRPWREAVNLQRKHVGYRADEYYVEVPESKSEAGTGRVVPITDAAIGRALLDKEGRLFRSRATYVRAWDAPFPIQALRRLAISRWCEDQPLDVVRMRAGHSDLRVTLEIYNEVTKTRILTGKGVNEGVRVSEVLGGNDPI